MNANGIGVALHIFGIPLALGNDPVFAEERFGGFWEFFAGLDLPPRVFSLQAQVPVLGEVLGVGQALLPGCDTPVPTGQIGRALPKVAVFSLVNVEFSSQEVMLFQWLRPY